MTISESDSAHLSWLIKNRSKTQSTSLKLFKVVANYSNISDDEEHYAASQELVAVAFSLWRAVFLADKSGEKGSSLKAAQKFLGTLLTDNAINYPQDRATREWTFNYYTTNAWLHLIRLNRYSPTGVTDRFLSPVPKQRWEHLQAGFEKAVTDFSKDSKKQRNLGKLKT